MTELVRNDFSLSYSGEVGAVLDVSSKGCWNGEHISLMASSTDFDPAARNASTKLLTTSCPGNFPIALSQAETGVSSAFSCNLTISRTAAVHHHRTSGLHRVSAVFLIWY